MSAQYQDDWNNYEEEEWEVYAEEHDPNFQHDQKLIRRPPKAKFENKVPFRENWRYRMEEEIRRSITGDFETTYRPGQVERRWLMGALRPFFVNGLVDDILSKVKGGKDADVYRCSLTAPDGTLDLFAAKTYRPRSHRTMRNDMVYREGRDVLALGTNVSSRQDKRLLRAMLKRSDYGKQAQQTSWLLYERHALTVLREVGADVPEPFDAADNAILMEFIGDAQVAAPTLNEVRLDPSEVKSSFDQVMHNVELMLTNGFIHGDLSAHNLLFWDDRVVVIDFPQVVPVTGNKQAYGLLERDVERVCQYWARYGLRRDPERLTRSLWGNWSQVRHEDVMADLSKALAEMDEDDEDPDEDWEYA